MIRAEVENGEVTSFVDGSSLQVLADAACFVQAFSDKFYRTEESLGMKWSWLLISGQLAFPSSESRAISLNGMTIEEMEEAVMKFKESFLENQHPDLEEEKLRAKRGQRND